MNDPQALRLIGLRADNPLAFLAAMGLLRAAAGAFGHDTVRLRWQPAGGAWTPELRVNGSEPVEADTLAFRLHAWLQGTSGQRAFAIADDLTLSPEAFRACSRAAAEASTAADRDHADFIAAFGCDGVELVENGKRTGKIADTAFRTMSGAGHQHFLGFMRTLAVDCTAEHLSRALFAHWRYDDPMESHTLRWDPVDDVRYALRWRDSSGDPERKRGGAMWGANRLAIEGLPMLPTMPQSNGQLGTVGFTHARATGSAWTWPVWDAWCGIDTVRTLLALPALQPRSPDRRMLRALGVAEVFRCHRIRQGKYRNLTPGVAV